MIIRWCVRELNGNIHHCTNETADRNINDTSNHSSGETTIKSVDNTENLNNNILVDNLNKIIQESKKGKVCQSSTESELLAFKPACNILFKLRILIKF